jgi:YbgC/YbaW family acyl-CoA thioester hydrolase
VPHEFRTKRKIEFVDTDLAGVVHFSRFFIFMETAEHEFLRSLGTSVAAKMDGMQLGWPRLAASCEYLSPARFEDVLDIRVIVAKKGKRSLTYNFIIEKGEALIARGQMVSVCCLVDPEKGFRTIPLPAFLAEQIQEAPVPEDRG